MRLHPLRKLIILVTLLLTASSLLAIPVASAQSPTRDFGAESGFLSSLNSQRAAGGLAPLTLHPSMTAAADGWALSMANGSFLAHASDIVSGTPGGWTKVGENVGRGQSVASLTSAFMASPGHRANIMDGSYTHIGIAVYNHPSDGRMYTTHRFAALPGSAPAPVVAAPVAAPTATPVPPTPVPPTPVPPTPVPATPVPTAIPATPVPATPVPTTPPAPTATPIPPLVTTPEPEPTPIPATPVPTEVPATPTPEPTAIPATAVPATPVPATPVPATPTPAAPEADEEAPEDGFGTPPEQLAFVDADGFEEASQAKLESKTAKFRR